jgi:hypothetical protein
VFVKTEHQKEHQKAPRQKPGLKVCGLLWRFVAIACVENSGSSGNLEKLKKSFAILGEYWGTRKQRKFRFVAVIS